jgi:hypothetical protein
LNAHLNEDNQKARADKDSTSARDSSSQKTFPHPMGFVPDPHETTAEIPVMTSNEGFHAFPEGPLPALKEGILCRLIVPAFAFKEAADKSRYTRVCKKCVPPEGTILRIALSFGKEVTVRLDGELWMRVRGERRPSCENVACTLIEEKRTAQSLNHAYAIASAQHEKERRSHTGNIYRSIYFQDSRGRWRPLEDLRVNVEVQQEMECGENHATLPK